MQQEKFQVVDMTSQDADEKLTTIAENIARRNRGRSLNAWTHDMHVNEQKITRWENGVSQTAFLPPDVPVHPGERAAHSQRQWAKLWRPEVCRETDGIDKLLEVRVESAATAATDEQHEENGKQGSRNVAGVGGGPTLSAMELLGHGDSRHWSHPGSVEDCQGGGDPQGDRGHTTLIHL